MIIANNNWKDYLCILAGANRSDGYKMTSYRSKFGDKSILAQKLKLRQGSIAGILGIGQASVSRIINKWQKGV